MKTLLCYIPSVTDCTSFYRAAGPLWPLARKYGFRLMSGNDCNWTILKSADAVFIQRPSAIPYSQIVDMVKDSGKPLWVDYDDDLYCVPRNNPTHKVYSRQEIQNVVTKCLDYADFVTVSTSHLQDRLDSVIKMVKAKKKEFYTSKTTVIPNAYDYDLFKHYRIPKQREQNRLISWRGSETHDKDLLFYSKQIAEVMGKNLEWVYSFIGGMFWLVEESLWQIPKIKKTNLLINPAIDVIEYHKFLYRTQPKSMLVPLFDETFNRSKSNIAWIEGAHAGAMCLAPDWEEWRRPGCLNYTDQKDFADKFDHLLRGNINHEDEAQKAWDYVMDNLQLNKVNEKRYEIIQRMFG